MKRELALTGIALVISVLLSSPSVAQPATRAEPAPAPVEITLTPEAEELSIDEAILFASTPEERAMLLRRCAGPPPMPPAELAAEAPASEPATPAG